MARIRDVQRRGVAGKRKKHATRPSVHPSIHPSLPDPSPIQRCLPNLAADVSPVATNTQDNLHPAINPSQTTPPRERLEKGSPSQDTLDAPIVQHPSIRQHSIAWDLYSPPASSLCESVSTPLAPFLCLVCLHVRPSVCLPGCLVGVGSWHVGWQPHSCAHLICMHITPTHTRHDLIELDDMGWDGRQRDRHSTREGRVEGGRKRQGRHQASGVGGKKRGEREVGPSCIRRCVHPSIHPSDTKAPSRC